MSFDDCEMAILRHSVDESETRANKRVANAPEITKMVHIVDEFLKRKKLICYGGTAINNILPKSVQFYDKSVEIPDYDFFSPNAMTDAKELADVYNKSGYTTVEAKSGVHAGTYKVYVNHIGIADITYLHPTLYSALSKESIRIAGIRYAPANYLRMGMFLELSRPEGDVSRWEKVLKRMNLLNKYYPLKSNVDCTALEIQRTTKHNANLSEKMFFLTREALIDQGVVFFGGYAASLYSRYMKNVESRVENLRSMKIIPKRTPDFDVLAEDPSATATAVVEYLRANGIRHIKLVQHTKLGEVIPEHIELIVSGDTIAFIYQTIACHSYNTITIDHKPIHIATIDTMLSFYLAFMYANKKYYDKHRILCLSMYLFQVEQHNRLSQKGLLHRFSTKCYGKQGTLETIRAKKARRYAILSENPKSVEFETEFLKYAPKPFAKPATMSKTRKSISETRSIVEEYSGDEPRETILPKIENLRRRSHSKFKPRSINTRKRRFRKPFIQGVAESQRRSKSAISGRDEVSYKNAKSLTAEKSLTADEVLYENTPNSYELRSPEFPRTPSAARPEYFTNPTKSMPHYGNWLSRLRNED